VGFTWKEKVLKSLMVKDLEYCDSIMMLL